LPSPDVRLNVTGEEHVVHAVTATAPKNSRHSVAVPGSAVKVQVTVVALEGPVGPETTGGAGAVVSRRYDAEPTAPVLPAASVARTFKVYVPSPWLSVRTLGDVHDDHAPVPPGPVNRHSVVDPASAVNVKVMVVLLLGEAGAVTTGAAGAAVSRV